MGPGTGPAPYKFEESALTAEVVSALSLFYSYAQAVNKKISFELVIFFLHVNKKGAILSASAKTVRSLFWLCRFILFLIVASMVKACSRKE